MGEKPTKKEILAAVKKSGYLMEQEVATIFELLDFYVQTNRAYEDFEERKSREIDVSARRAIGSGHEAERKVWIEFICECKNNTNPFVFIRRSKSLLDKYYEPMEYLFPKKHYRHEVKPGTHQYVPAFHHLELGEHHYYFKQTEKAVQFCKIVGHPNKWEAQHNGIYDAIFYPLVKALWALRQERGSLQSSYAFLFFPVVVLNGPMYYIDSMAKELEVVKTTHVTFVRELKFKSVKGRFMVDFVAKNALQTFIKSDVIPFAERVSKLLETGQA